MARYKHTLPRPDGSTRGYKYLANVDIISDEVNLIGVVAETLNESNKLFIEQLIRDRNKLKDFPGSKNNPLAQMVMEAYHSLTIQMAVMANKLAMIENSALKIAQATQENKQIVDDNLSLPTGLQTDIEKLLSDLQTDIKLLREQLEDEQ